MKHNMSDIRHLLGDLSEVGLSASFKDLSGRTFKQIRGGNKYRWVTFDELPDCSTLIDSCNLDKEEWNRRERLNKEFCEKHGFDEKDYWIDFDHPDAIELYRSLVEFLKSYRSDVVMHGDLNILGFREGVGCSFAIPEATAIYKGGPSVLLDRVRGEPDFRNSDPNFTSKVRVYVLGAEDKIQEVEGLVTKLQGEFPQLRPDKKVIDVLGEYTYWSR